MRRPLSLALIALVSATSAMADPATTVRVGRHPGFGRVVFEFAALDGFHVERLGDVAIVHFDGAGSIPNAASGTLNVTGVRGGDSEAVIELAAGARLRTARIGNRVVIDALDAARPAMPVPRKAVLAQRQSPVSTPPTATATATPTPVQGSPEVASLPALSPTAVVQAPLPAPAEAAPPASPMPASPMPASPMPASLMPASPMPASSMPPPPEPAHEPAAPTEPMALAAARLQLPPGMAGVAALLPFGPKVGAAAYRRNGTGWIVFDERRPIDMAALRDDSLLAKAVVQLLPNATLVHLPLADGAALRLTRQASGWSVAALPATAMLEPIIPVAQDDHLLLPAAAGSVVVVPDTDTGQNLLVGTLRGTSGGVPISYRQPEFILQPSWQGILVEPISDQVSLHTSPAGFVLETGSAIPAPPAATAALDTSAFLTRRFDFAADKPPELMRRLQSQVAEAGGAPPQSRGQPRIAAAQTMISLGMGAEAQSVLGLAIEEDPRLAAKPDVQGLSAIAAILSGRLTEAAGLDDPALTGSDEIALWRAVRAAQRREGAPEAAPVFASTLPIILAYPQALQNRLLPLAAETMAVGGAPDVADALLAARPDDARLTYARALRLEAKGQTEAALAVYDALADARDRLASTRAATRATLLRLSTGAMTAAAGAKSLESQFLAWRGDARERDLRLRAATLHAQAGEWRPAFDLLRETSVLYPQEAELINGKRADLLRDLLVDPNAAAIAPIDLVALAEENAEIVAAVAPAESAGLLADKLVGLDLPRRAEPLLDRMTRAAAGLSRAALGFRLATVRFGLGDDAGAAAALEVSAVPDMTPALSQDRILLGARIMAHRGNPGAAASSLAMLDSPEADDLSATLLTDAGDWRAAEAALQKLADRTVPALGLIDPAQQDTLRRLATAQQRAGDTTALYALGKRMAGRMTGPRADVLRLLAAAPIGAVGDLRRASSEIALARSIPSALSAIGSR